MGKVKNAKEAVKKINEEIASLPNEAVKIESKANESVDIHYVQLQNLVMQERADKEYYKNLVNSFIEYLDAEQTQMNQNRQIFKKALANPPSVRTKVNPPAQPPKEDNKNKKKKK